MDVYVVFLWSAMEVVMGAVLLLKKIMHLYFFV
jgi:hypothetical protein